MQTKLVQSVAVLGLVLAACSTPGPERSVESARQAELVDGVEGTSVVSDALAAKLAALEPIRTRKGTLRFVGDDVRDPAMASALLARLSAGVEDAELRAALVEALPRTGGEYGAALVAMLPTEAEADVRIQIVAALQRADATSAHAAIVVALADEDPAVRSEAARVASMREDGGALAGELQAALTDEAPPVRAAAARTIGVLGLADARDGLLPGLTDDDAEVRLQSLRALARIDPEHARTLSQLATLASDADARVAGVATQIAGAE